MHGETIKKKI